MSETRQAEILIDVIDSDNEMAAFDLHGWQLRSPRRHFNAIKTEMNIFHRNHLHLFMSLI